MIRGFDELFAATRPDFAPYYRELATREAHAPSTVLAADRLYHRGTAPTRAA